MIEEIEKVSEKVAQQATETSHKEMVQNLNNALNKEGLLPIIREKIIIYIKKLEEFHFFNRKNNTATIGQLLRLLEDTKNIIYKDFFEIQNLLNAYLGQEVIITYVNVDDQGNRSIRVSKNNIQNLGIESGTTFYGSPYYKLGYDFELHYSNLKNSLPQEENNKLSDTAFEIERRYKELKKKVLWKYNDKIFGYYLPSRGPINEAFVNFYIHDIKLLGNMESDIHRYMLDTKYGAIKADNTKGYFIGDVARDGIQYAVKGQFGSPQGFIEISNQLKKLVDEDFSMSSFYSFIEKYTTQELEKNYTPHIKQLTQKTIDNTVKDFEKYLKKYSNK